MKKYFVFIFICLFSVLAYGQKQFSSENFCVETVDEFGDKTGNIRVGIMAKGYFSNSATTNSCAQLMLYKSNITNHMYFNLYEYCGNHTSKDYFRITLIGTTTKEIISDSYCIDDIPSFIKLCESNDTINVRLKEIGDYASTSAVFRLFNCKKFAELYKNPTPTE